jgi:hypothetical protein
MITEVGVLASLRENCIDAVTESTVVDFASSALSDL